MSKNAALTLAGLIFALVAIGHILRLYYGLDINVSGTSFPPWASVVAIIVAVVLSALMFGAKRRG